MSAREAGLYADLSNEAYHSETDWLSSTMLKTALPERYAEVTDWSRPALEFGTLVHAVVLEPDHLDRYAVLDAAKVGVKADGTPADNPTATKAWKTAVAEAATNGLTVISQEDWDKAHRMADAVRAHPEAAELLYDGEGQYEESAFAVDADGVPCRARFDRRTPGRIVDLKTTSAKPGHDSLVRSVIDYGYEVSARHYLTVADALGLDVEEFVLVFVDKSQHPRVTVARFDSGLLARGDVLRRRAIARLTDPDAEQYDGATGSLTLTCPPWARLTDAPAAIPADFTWSIYDNA